MRTTSGQVATPFVDTAVDDPVRTITGREQLDWLKASLTAPAQWKLVGNPVMIGILPRDGSPYNTDQWDGYTDDRREVFAHIRDRGLRDVVFLTGDIHSGWACDLPYDASTYPLGDSAGVEFVCTSVTSNNLDDITGTPPRTSSLAVEAAIQTNNRLVRYLNFEDRRPGGPGGGRSRSSVSVAVAVVVGEPDRALTRS